MVERFQLGKYAGLSGDAVIPISDEDRIKLLENKMATVLQMLNNVNTSAMSNSETKNKIPVGTTLIGKTKDRTFFLTVMGEGYNVGITKYDSLSAAAEAVSGCRRSGWAFWKLNDGRTAKEVFKDA